jgi:hypothetical protein
MSCGSSHAPAIWSFLVVQMPGTGDVACAFLLAHRKRRASKDVVYTTSSRISSVRRPFGLALRTLSCAPPTFRRFDIAALGHFARNVVFSKNLSTRR